MLVYPAELSCRVVVPDRLAVGMKVRRWEEMVERAMARLTGERWSPMVSVQGTGSISGLLLRFEGSETWWDGCAEAILDCRAFDGQAWRFCVL